MNNSKQKSINNRSKNSSQSYSHMDKLIYNSTQSTPQNNNNFNKLNSNFLQNSQLSRYNLESQIKKDHFTQQSDYNPFNPQKSYLNKLQKSQIKQYISIEDPTIETINTNTYNRPQTASVGNYQKKEKPVTYFFDNQQNLTKQDQNYLNMVRIQQGQNLRTEGKFMNFMVNLENIREKSDTQLQSQIKQVNSTQNILLHTKFQAAKRQLHKESKPSKMDFLINQAEQITNKEEKQKYLEQLIRVYNQRNLISHVKEFEAKQQLKKVITDIQYAKKKKDKPVKYLFNKDKMAQSLMQPQMMPVKTQQQKQKLGIKIDFSKPIQIDFLQGDGLGIDEPILQKAADQEYHEKKKQLVTWDKFGFKIRKEKKQAVKPHVSKKLNVEALLQDAQLDLKQRAQLQQYEKDYLENNSSPDISVRKKSKSPKNAQFTDDEVFMTKGSTKQQKEIIQQKMEQKLLRNDRNKKKSAFLDVNAREISKQKEVNIDIVGDLQQNQIQNKNQLPRKSILKNSQNKMDKLLKNLENNQQNSKADQMSKEITQIQNQIERIETDYDDNNPEAIEERQIFENIKFDSKYNN